MIETKEVKRGEWVLRKLPDNFMSATYEIVFYIDGKEIDCIDNYHCPECHDSFLLINELLNPDLKDGE